MAELTRYDEWLAELSRISLHADEGFTTQDVATAYGISRESASRRIRNWVDAGLVKHTGHRDGHARDGKRIVIPVYSRAK